MENQIILNMIKSTYLDMFYKGFNDSNVALLYYYTYQQDFIYDPESKRWFYFNKYGIFENDLGNIFFYKKYNDLYRQIETQFTKTLLAEEVEENKAKILKNYKCGIGYVKKNKTKKDILSECIIHFAKKNIAEKLNSVNTKIIGFKNGVYDLENNIFRNGKPEELVTVTTGYNYRKVDPIHIDNVKKLLSDCIPDNEELEYVLKTLSLSLVHENPLEEFYCWQGTGGNGKGLISKILYGTLGDYCGTLSIEYLTKSKGELNHNAGAADPQMADLRYCRLVISTEPEADADTNIKLKSSKLKLLSGNDVVKTRFLRENCFYFVPKFKIIIQTNFDIGIDGSDDGMGRRFRRILWRMSFVDNPTKENQRKKDYTLKDKIITDDYKLAMFEILKEKYFLFVKNGVKIPDRIQQDIDQYMEDNNTAKPFLDNKVEKTDNPKDRVLTSKMYEEFKTYVNNKIDGFNPSKFRTTMTKNGFITKKIGGNNYYLNCRIKEDAEIDDDDMDL